MVNLRSVENLQGKSDRIARCTFRGRTLFFKILHHGSMYNKRVHKKEKTLCTPELEGWLGDAPSREIMSGEVHESTQLVRLLQTNRQNAKIFRASCAKAAKKLTKFTHVSHKKFAYLYLVNTCCIIVHRAFLWGLCWRFDYPHYSDERIESSYQLGGSNKKHPFT